MLLSIVEKLEDIISNDDSGLSAENVGNTHIFDCDCVVIVLVI